MLKLFAALIGLTISPAVLIAQSSPVVGTWKLVAADVITPDGRTVTDYGSAPSGLAVFTADGQYMVEIYRGPVDRMKFASKDRSKGTPEEYREAQLSTSTHFGRYAIDEANHTMTFAIVSSSYPNLDGTTQVRPYTLQGDSLAWHSAPRPDGSVPVSRFVRAR
jgi:hypothetical protein